MTLDLQRQMNLTILQENLQSVEMRGTRDLKISIKVSSDDFCGRGVSRGWGGVRVGGETLRRNIVFLPD